MSPASSRSRSVKRLWICSWISRPVVVDQLGRDRARLDQSDPHVAPGHLLAQRLAEGADPELGRVVDAAAGAGDAPGYRGDVDHVGDPARLAGRRLEQVGHRRVGGVEEAEQVDLDHLLPFVDRGVDHGAEQHHAGVVDQDVEPAQLGGDPRHRGPGLLALADVGLDLQRPAARRLDLSRQGLQPVGPAGEDRHGRAVCGQRPRRRLPDPAGGPGHQRHRPTKPSHAPHVTHPPTP